MKTPANHATWRWSRAGMSVVVALAVAVISTLSFAPAANAVPKGVLTASQNVGLTLGQTVTLTLTNYPAEVVRITQCSLSGPGLTVGECGTPQTVTVPDAGGGRGTTTAAVVAAATAGAQDCALVICGWVTESDGVTKNTDSAVKLTFAFGGTPTLTVAESNIPWTAAATPVTVHGTGFRPNTTLRLTQCQVASTNTGCRATLGSGYAEPTSDAAGEFTGTINIDGSWLASGTQFNCWESTADACGIATSSKTSGADRTQQAVVSVDLGDAQLAASKSTGISTAGESITVTGSGFKPNVNMFLVNCDADVPSGGACDMAHASTVTADAAGAFSQTVTAASFAGTDCLVKSCGLMTSRTDIPTDHSQEAVLPLSFVAPVTAALTASKTTDLNPDGESVTVNGTGFEPGINVFLTLCDTTKAPGSACDMANFKQVPTGTGSFAQEITVKATFGSTDCRTTTCALMTSKVGAGADMTQVATLPMTFAATAPPVPPATPTATLASSKTTGIATTGETITVTGSSYKPGIGLFVTLCNTQVPNGGACDMVNFKSVTTDASGAFSTTIKVASKFQAGSNSVDCMVVPCAIQTSRIGMGSDLTQQVSLPVSFSVPAPTGATLSANKTTGINAAGESLQVKGTGFKSKVDLFVTLCDPSVANGGSCDMENFGQVTTDAAGAFQLPLKVVGKFTSAAGSINCLAISCALMTSRVGMGSDLTQQTSLPLAFQAGTAPVNATVKLSKSKGLSAGGTKVKVTGKKFAASSMVKVALCKKSAKVGKSCDKARDKSVRADGQGAFKAKLKVTSSFGKGKAKVDCVKVKCAIKTWSAKNKSDKTQQTKNVVRFKGARKASSRRVTARRAAIAVSRTSVPTKGVTQVTVSGSGYQPRISIYLALCNTKVANGGACDMGRFKTVKTSSSGTFRTSIAVKGRFSSAAGKVNCRKVPCGLQTSKVGSGADRSQQVTKRMTFTSSSRVVAHRGQARAANVRVSRTSLPLKGATTVNVTGAGYQPGVSLYVVTCNLQVAKGGSCDMGRFRTVKTSRTGTFATTMSIAGKFSSAAGAVNCKKVPCGVQTSKVGQGADTSQQRTVRLKFL